ncbi:ESF1 homolog isoform X2 [Xenopus laevis]|uniref:ESF1 homolog isoform X2 n=1 Tax=Xenopus laevis TaxID=8355 RepID=A0A8J0VAI2_XENLA|nr:ESF1 homolog isoform X2 [Xenopus laevis]
MTSKPNLASDQRFSRVTKDPRFWEMPEKDKKIKIDKRFQGMFHDKKFNLKYTVDKRGRPINHNTTEDLKRFYDLSDSDEEGEKDRGPSSSKTVKQKGKTKTHKDLESEPRKTKAKESKAKNGKLSTTQESSRDEGEPRLKGKGKAGLIQSKQKDTHILRSDTKITSVASAKSVTQTEEEELGDEAESEGYSESESLSDSEDSEGQSLGSDAESEEAKSDDESGEESEGDEEGSQEEDEEESDSGPDLARGKGNIETSSEDEDEDEDDTNELLQKEPEIEHDWRELDKDAPRGDQVTNRLAVCNMDWDRLKAKDLLALFNSFKPKGGIIFSVKIYPSEYGKERLKEEELHGPQELKNVSEDVADEQGNLKEKLREYQFKRLKYFYAVVECDTLETANKIYEECDGLEFESSCSFVDLRFIPNDVQFSDEPKDSAVDVDLSAYKPKLFTTAAVATSKVEITWDETDHDRITTLNRPFKKTEILDMDFQAYLASSSEEEEEDSDPDMGENEDTKSKKSSKDDEEQITRYRELLKSINNKDKKEDNDMEMEIKWVPGLKESAEQMVKSKLDGKDQQTPWEKYLQKKKDKRKMKKKKDKHQEEEEEEEEEDAKEEDDDDAIPSDVDLNDPYFSEELKKPGLKAKSSSSKKDNVSSEDEAEKEKQKAQIALLMMDDVEDDRKHFNYDQIVEQQNLSKRKKKQLKKKEELVEDEFQINVEDSRFQAMYTSHFYNIDPSDPSYKKTKAMGRVLEEKARRREKEQDSRSEAVKRHAAELETQQKKGTDPALSMLLKSVKNKTQQFQASKKQKIK